MDPLSKDFMSNSAISLQANRKNGSDSNAKVSAAASQPIANAAATAPAKPLDLKLQQKLIESCVGRLAPLFSGHGNGIDVTQFHFLELHQFIDLSLITLFASICRLRKPNLGIPKKIDVLQASITEFISAKKWKTVNDPTIIKNEENVRILCAELGIDPLTQKGFNSYLSTISLLMKQTNSLNIPIGIIKDGSQNAALDFQRRLIAELSPIFCSLIKNFGVFLKKLLPEYSKEALATVTTQDNDRPNRIFQEISLKFRRLHLYMTTRMRAFELACENLEKPQNRLNGIDTLLTLGKRFTNGFTRKIEDLKRQLFLFSNEVALNTYYCLSTESETCLQGLKELQFQIALDFCSNFGRHLEEFCKTDSGAFFNQIKTTPDALKYIFWALDHWTNAYLERAGKKHDKKLAPKTKQQLKKIEETIFGTTPEEEEKPPNCPKELTPHIHALKGFHSKAITDFSKRSQERLHKYFHEHCPPDFVSPPEESTIPCLITAGISRFSMCREKIPEKSQNTLGLDLIKLFAMPTVTSEIKQARQGVAIYLQALYIPIKCLGKRVESLGKALTESDKLLRAFSSPMKVLCEICFPLLEASRRGLAYTPLDPKHEDDWWLDADEQTGKNISKKLQAQALQNSQNKKETAAQLPSKGIATDHATPSKSPVVPPASMSCVSGIRYFLERHRNLPLLYQPSQVLSMPHEHNLEASVAYHQQLMSMTCVDGAEEMFMNCRDDKARFLIAQFLFLHRHVSVEQAFTEASIRHSVPNPYTHKIKSHLARLKISLQTPVTDRLCTPNTNAVRYPAHEMDRCGDLSKAPLELQLCQEKGRGILLEQLSKQLPELMREYHALLKAAFQKGRDNSVAQQFPEMPSKHLNPTVSGPKMDPVNEHSLMQIPGLFQDTLTNLGILIEAKTKDLQISKVKSLRNIHLLMEGLSVLPRLVKEFSYQRLLFCHAHICLFWTQYLAENVGAFLDSSDADELRGEHDLKVYRLMYGLGSHLKSGSQLWKTFEALNIEKGSEYFIGQFLKHDNARISDLVNYLNSLFVTSQVEIRKLEGYTFPQFKSLTLPEMHAELITFITQHAELSINLVKTHVLSKKL